MNWDNFSGFWDKRHKRLKSSAEKRTSVRPYFAARNAAASAASASGSAAGDGSRSAPSSPSKPAAASRQHTHAQHPPGPDAPLRDVAEHHKVGCCMLNPTRVESARFQLLNTS